MYFDERMKIGDEKENPSFKGLFMNANVWGKRTDTFRAKLHFFRHNPYLSFIPEALFFLAEI